MGARGRAGCAAIALTVSAFLLAGCSATRVPVDQPGTSPAGFVFLVHGIWPDNGDWWVDDAAAALHRYGIEGLPVPYRTFVGGYLFGYGTSPPADRVAQFAHALQRRHGKTGCAAPVRLHGVGYSAGTMVLTKAAERGVCFERVYFAGSPIKFWDGDLECVLVEGRILHLVNYYSPTDLLVWMSCGSGVFGYHGGGPAQDVVENRLHWKTHFTPLWDDDLRVQNMAKELARLEVGARHTCYEVPWYRKWYAEAKEKLRTAW